MSAKLSILHWEIGRYFITSRSRPGMLHLVDVGDRWCSCEDFEFTGQCDHLPIVSAYQAYEEKQLEKRICKT